MPASDLSRLGCLVLIRVVRIRRGLIRRVLIGCSLSRCCLIGRGLIGGCLIGRGLSGKQGQTGNVVDQAVHGGRGTVDNNETVEQLGDGGAEAGQVKFGVAGVVKGLRCLLSQ